jgi:hypothetical protein
VVFFHCRFTEKSNEVAKKNRGKELVGNYYLSAFFKLRGPLGSSLSHEDGSLLGQGSLRNNPVTEK